MSDVTVVTNADGSKVAGGYTVDAAGNLLKSPYPYAGVPGGPDGEGYNWGAVNTLYAVDLPEWAKTLLNTDPMVITDADHDALVALADPAVWSPARPGFWIKTPSSAGWETWPPVATVVDPEAVGTVITVVSAGVVTVDNPVTGTKTVTLGKDDPANSLPIGTVITVTPTGVSTVIPAHGLRGKIAEWGKDIEEVAVKLEKWIVKEVKRI